ncbi:MAG: cation transporter dimerization domain-containing protein [Pseudomonadota bacterium]
MAPPLGRLFFRGGPGGAERGPDPAKLGEIKNCALKTSGVREVHDIRVRTSGGLYQMEVHVVVDGSLTVSEGHQIAKEVELCLLREVEDVAKVIVHVDPKGPET